jgi:hypothetical protein
MELVPVLAEDLDGVVDDVSHDVVLGGRQPELVEGVAELVEYSR